MVRDLAPNGMHALERLGLGDEIRARAVNVDELRFMDGINSVLRRQLVCDGEPRVSGITVYRAIIPMEPVPQELRWNAVTWWAGPKCHFVHYPIMGGKYLNLAASSDDGVTEAFAGVPATKAHVRRECWVTCTTAWPGCTARASSPGPPCLPENLTTARAAQDGPQAAVSRTYLDEDADVLTGRA